MADASLPSSRPLVSVSGNSLIVIVGLLCLMQAVVLSFIRGGTSYDGAEQLLYTQSFEWGYGRSQPPLYTWMLIAVQQLFGVTQFSENLLKFASLFAFVFLMWRIGLKLGLRPPAAVTLAVSPFLIVEIAWEVQRNYSHTVLLLALTAAFALAYLHTLSARGMRGYVVLGVIFGLMLLTKYNAALFVLALVVADLAAMRREGVFWTAKALLIPVIAGGLVVPHVIWALDHLDHVLAQQGRFRMVADDRAGALVSGLLAYFLACISILGLPLLMMLLHRGWTAIAANCRGRKQAFALWTLLSSAFGLILVLVSGATNVNIRWMLPLVIAALPVLCGLVADADPRANRHIRTLAIVVALIATPGQWIESLRDARKNYNYEELLQTAVQSTGATEFLINDYAILANLRLYDSDARIVHQIMPAAGSTPLSNPAMLWTGDDDAEQMLLFARGLGVCPAEPSPHTYMMRADRGQDPLLVHYQDLKTDCEPAG